MLLTSLSLLVISALARAPIAMAECGEPIPSGIVMINETAHDVVLFVMNSPDTTVSFHVKPFMADYLGDLNSHFAIRVQPKGLRQLIVTNPVDLDQSLVVGPDERPAQQFLINLMCTDQADGEVTQYHRTLSVTAVDEFVTIFPNKDSISISEDTPPLSPLGSIPDMISDADYEPIKYDVSYSLIDYERPGMDGKRLFDVDEMGVLILKDFLDYEDGDVLYYLNISVIRTYSSPSVAGQTAYNNLHGVVTIRILNVNDNPVEFVYNGCGPKCPIAYYITEIKPTFTGLLQNIKYGPTYAIDLDGDQVEYLIIGGSPRSYMSFFEINPQSGELTMKKVLNDETVILINLIIEAKSYSTLPTMRYEKPQNIAYSFIVISVKGRKFPDDSFSVQMFTYSGGERSIPKPYSTLLVVLMMAAVSL